VIASLRGLAVLAVVTLALALGVVLDRGGPPGVVDRALVPGLHRDDVTQLAWDRPAAALRRGTAAPERPIASSAGGAGKRDGAAWKWATPPVPADAGEVRDVLDALEAARWHRRGPASAAGAITATLRVRDKRGEHSIGIGKALPGTDQVWLVEGGRALLVDAWVARALHPAPLALRVRHPLAAAASAERLSIATTPPLALADHLRRRADGLWLAPVAVGALADRLAQLAYVALPTGPLGPAAGPAITAGAATVVPHGACPGHPALVALAAPDGDGCVTAADWQGALAAAAALAGAPAAVADRRPVPFAPRELAVDGGTVALTGHEHVSLAAGGTRDADPDRIAALFAACGAEAAWAAAPAGGAPLHHVVARGAAGAQVALDLYAGDLAHRDDGAWLHLSHDAWLALAAPAEAAVDPTRWAEDATSIASLALDGATFTRGAVVGEWHGARDQAAVEALAQTLAAVRAPAAVLPASFRAVHVIDVAFAPPVGAPSHHRLELGAPRADGCLARIDGAPALAPLPLCTAAAAAR
jgi:hypothetical protein